METLPENLEIFAAGFLVLILILKNFVEVKKASKEEIGMFSVGFWLLVLMTIIPLVPILLLLCAVYREIVRLMLKAKYGPQFAGLVTGADSVHTMDKPNDSIINTLLIFKYDKKRSSDNFYNDIKEVMRDRFFRHPDKLPKFHCIFLKSMGYSYMLREKLTVDDCLRRMDRIVCKNGKLNQEEFSQMVTDWCNSPLPRNDTVLWEMLVGRQSVLWNSKDNDEFNYYPAMIRVHHGVADGVTLMRVMAEAVADKADVNVISSEIYKRNNNQRSSNKYYPNNSKLHTELSLKSVLTEIVVWCTLGYKILQQVLMCLYVLCLTPATMFVNLAIKANDNNILQGPPLRGENTVVFSVEESQEYFHIVKKIKNAVPGTSFPEVLIAAFSASLNEYFQKREVAQPHYVTAFIPMLSGSSELQYIVPGSTDASKISLQNTYSFLLLNLPLALEDKEDSRKGTAGLDRLKSLKEETHILKHSVEYQVNYFIMNFVTGLLPHPLASFLLSSARCTTVLSVLPGPSDMTFNGGTLPLSAMIFWVPHLVRVGITFSVSTTNRRLQVGLNVDKALISDQREAQNIVDGVYRYLNLLKKEIDCSA